MPTNNAIKHNPKSLGTILVLLMIVSFAIIFSFVPKIPQWISYHNFADTRKLWGIPNFANVVSNSFYLFVSIFGFMSLQQQWKNKNINGSEAIVFFVLFSGVFLTSIGSSYYHWSPNNNSLVWDRIPMTIIFMSLLAFTIMERINMKLGFQLLVPLLAFGIFSVLYWHWTELLGQGDLRLYGLVQFYSIFLILLVLLFFPKPYPPLKYYGWMLVFYALAKIFEFLDVTIFKFDELISGHTLKHIFSAISVYWTVAMLNAKRESHP